MYCTAINAVHRMTGTFWLLSGIFVIFTLSNALPIPSKPLRNYVTREYERRDVVDGFVGSPDVCNIETVRDVLNNLRTMACGESCREKMVFDDCCQPLWLGMGVSAIYTLAAPLNQMAYCDMEHGGWIVLMRRTNGKRDFHRNWRRYERGFGKLDKEFWLGLIAMHRLSLLPGGLEVRLEITHSNGSKYFAHYDHFYVANGSANYQLTITGYNNQSTIPELLSSFNSGHPFTTLDRDNDNNGRINCAQMTRGGWWHASPHPHSCAEGGVPTSLYIKSQGGVQWFFSLLFTEPRSLGAPIYSFFPLVEMKVRPKAWHCGTLQMLDKVQINFITVKKHYPGLLGEDEGSGE